MIPVTALLLLGVLIYLSLPPRDGARWAFACGFLLTLSWLLFVALSRGLAPEYGRRALLWALALAALGAPLIQLFVWSAVAAAIRPRAPHPTAAGDRWLPDGER